MDILLMRDKLLTMRIKDVSLKAKFLLSENISDFLALRLIKIIIMAIIFTY
jgi:hypothetical protein